MSFLSSRLYIFQVFVFVAAFGLSCIAHSQNEEPRYVAIRQLLPGQDEIATNSVIEKKQDRLQTGYFYYDNRGLAVLKFDEGKSVTPKNDPVSVIQFKERFVIIDGHHEVFLGLDLGATTVAIKVVQDLSYLSEVEFWRHLKKNNLIRIHATAEQLAKAPLELDQVRDNPMRYFVGNLVKKVTVSNSKLISVKGRSDAFLMKINNGYPFIEFIIADILQTHGVIYQPEWSQQIPPDVKRNIREILQSSDDPKVREMVFPSDTINDFHQLENYLIQRQVVQLSCRSFFM